MIILVLLTIVSLISIVFIMEAIQEIKAKLQAALGKIDKVTADVALLHSKIDNLPEAPTAEEIQELKDLSTEINDKLQAVDDSTPEETTEDSGSGETV